MARDQATSQSGDRKITRHYSGTLSTASTCGIARFRRRADKTCCLPTMAHTRQQRLRPQPSSSSSRRCNTSAGWSGTDRQLRLVRGCPANFVRQVPARRRDVRRPRFSWLRELLCRFEPTAKATDFAVSSVDSSGWLRVEMPKTLGFCAVGSNQGHAACDAAGVFRSRSARRQLLD